MSKRGSVYNSRWVSCRHKVCKFLNSISVSSPDQVNNEELLASDASETVNMQKLKRCVRSAKNPLIQIAHRLEEAELARHAGYSGMQALVEDTVTVCTTSPNNCFVMDDGKYCLCHETMDGQTNLLCEVFTQTMFLYEKPCDSRLLGIHKVRLKNTRMKELRVEQLVRKAIFVHINNDYGVMLPFMHSF